MVEELLAVARLGVCYQEFLTLVPEEHVGCTVVYAWKVGGCDVDVKGGSKELPKGRSYPSLDYNTPAKL